MHIPILHRLLLLMLSEKYRREFGAELSEFWAMQEREPRYSGVVGRVRLVFALFADAASLALKQRTARAESVSRNSRAKKGSVNRESRPISMMLDLRYAFRTLGGSKLHSVVVILTLALGIGATGAAYSVVERVVLRPLPYPMPDRLVQIHRTLDEGKTRSLSWPDFWDYRENAAGFLAVSAYYGTEATFSWESGAESMEGAAVSREFFETMGVQPMLGRTFTEQEDRPGGPNAVVVSYRFWDRYLGRDPDVLVKTIPMWEEQVPVVGVMPEGFSYPLENTWFWSPLREDELLAELGLPTGTRTLHFLVGVGRLNAGIELSEAETRLRSLATTIDVESGKPEELHTNIHLVSLQEFLIGDMDTTLFFLLGASGLVLLVACANVASLSLSRAAARQRELAVRAALGAGRARLLRQLLAETLLLSIAGGLVGVLVAATLQQGLLFLAPAGFSEIQGLGISGPVLMFVGAATVTSGLLFGFFPALSASAPNLTKGLAGGRGSSAGRNALRPQQMLVTLQVTLAVVLLVGATLLLTSFARLTGVDRGFQTEGVLVASVDPGTDRYDTPESVDALYGDLLDRVRSIPGVAAASATFSPPLWDNGFWTTVEPEGVDSENAEPFEAALVIVRDGYFDANGVQLLSGRDFGPEDRLGEAPVAIVSRNMASALWPGRDAVGKRFEFAGGVRGSAEDFEPAFFPSEPYTVVGVADDVRRNSLAQPPELEYYRPQSQITWAYQYLVIKATDPSAVVAPLRQTLRAVDPAIPMKTIQLLNARVSESVALERVRSSIVGAFALLTAFLSMIGLYAVLALAVTRRTKEMGIRLALGAHGSAIVRRVVGQGFGLVGLGIVFGLAGAFALSRTLAEMLFQIEPTDPLTYVMVAAATTLVAFLACYPPARRAARVDPLSTLREE